MAEMTPEEKIDRERVRLWKDMVNTPGWKMYVDLLEARMAEFGTLILAPMENLLQAPKFEYQKGTLNGLQLAYDTVPALLRAHSQTAAESDADDTGENDDE